MLLLSTTPLAWNLEENPSVIYAGLDATLYLGEVPGDVLQLAEERHQTVIQAEKLKVSSHVLIQMENTLTRETEEDKPFLDIFMKKVNDIF